MVNKVVGELGFNDVRRHGEKGPCLNFNKHDSQFVCSFSKRDEGSLRKKRAVIAFFSTEDTRNRNACLLIFHLNISNVDCIVTIQKNDDTFLFLISKT